MWIFFSLSYFMKQYPIIFFNLRYFRWWKCFVAKEKITFWTLTPIMLNPTSCNRLIWSESKSFIIALMSNWKTALLQQNTSVMTMKLFVLNTMILIEEQLNECVVVSSNNHDTIDKRIQSHNLLVSQHSMSHLNYGSDLQKSCFVCFYNCLLKPT